MPVAMKIRMAILCTKRAICTNRAALTLNPSPGRAFGAGRGTFPLVSFVDQTLRFLLAFRVFRDPILRAFPLANVISSLPYTLLRAVGAQHAAPLPSRPTIKFSFFAVICGLASLAARRCCVVRWAHLRSTGILAFKRQTVSTVQPQKKWIIAEPAPDIYVERLRKHDIYPTLATLLYRRGYETPDDALAFLQYYDGDDNPFRLKGMIEAVYRLRMAIRRGERIAVYGDFDCDGVTSTALLTEVLARLGANVCPYIPNRVDEGYGLNSPALKKLADDGVSVVVTVDCGIRSIKEVEDAKSYGLDMIISDHHSVGAELPDAYAVINPKQPGCAYPEKMLAGVGLAYKLAEALYMEGVRRKQKGLDEWHPADWLDLVAIGTVADIAPLTGENRELVRRGLRQLNHPKRPGLMALYQVAKIRPGLVNSVTIGFII